MGPSIVCKLLSGKSRKMLKTIGNSAQVVGPFLRADASLATQASGAYAKLRLLLLPRKQHEGELRSCSMAWGGARWPARALPQQDRDIMGTYSSLNAGRLSSVKAGPGGTTRAGTSAPRLMPLGRTMRHLVATKWECTGDMV